MSKFFDPNDHANSRGSHHESDYVARKSDQTGFREDTENRDFDASQMTRAALRVNRWQRITSAENCAAVIKRVMMTEYSTDFLNGDGLLHIQLENLKHLKEKDAVREQDHYDASFVTQAPKIILS